MDRLGWPRGRGRDRMITTTTPAPAAARPVSEVPYLPGLDGMRALAVVAVMVYHANSSWLPGGFLGVEVFFVISGYLITLLLIGEHERTGTLSLKGFYGRRARRLLPALFTLLIGITIYTALFRRDALGQLRGDVLAALAYVSNWYQIWVGQGYTASGDFAPLRHLWSLAVEEQFYLLWPLAMILLLRLGRRRLPSVSWALVVIAVAIAGIMAALYHPGLIGTCTTTPEAYWQVGGRCISKVDTLYLSTPTRATGLLLGAAFAMVWRPAAVLRGPMRDRGPMLDGVALVGLGALAALCWTMHIVTAEGADAWLFRGGFLLTDVATLAVIAAVTHRHAAMGSVLGTSPLVWVGLRSYGLYLYSWAIYQGIRRVAGNALTVPQFIGALAAAAVVAELSYRFIETPIRKGALRRAWRRLRDGGGSATTRRTIVTAGAAVVTLTALAGVSLATAEVKPNAIAKSIAEGERGVGDPFATTTSTVAAATTTTKAPATAPTTVAVTRVPTTPAPTVARTTAARAPAPTIAPTAARTTAAPAPRPPTGDPCAATPIAKYAIGDSVMLGAAVQLKRAGFCVDAIESRAFVNGLQRIIDLHAAGRLGPVVVVALGTNGPISDRQLAHMMTELSGVPKVVVLTIKADRSWIPGDNDKIRALPATYRNVKVLDWANLAASCPGHCLYDDGIHLPPDGRNFYAQQIVGVTG
jgi:peptidoglycan/LPS O-acetylase OafA/YrhL